MADNGSWGKFSGAMSSGLVATIGWVFVLIVYCFFRWSGIEDPFLGQAFVLLTGAWIGALTLAMSKKQAVVEKKVETVEVKVDTLLESSKITNERVDEAEKRETGPNKHSLPCEDEV